MGEVIHVESKPPKLETYTPPPLYWVVGYVLHQSANQVLGGDHDKSSSRTCI